jgi:hypothetical protein
MPTLRNLPVEVDVAQMLEREGNPDNESIVTTAHWAAQRCQELSQPSMVFSLHPASTLEGKRLQAGAAQLNIGPHIRLFDAAKEVAAGVVTLGGSLEREIKERQAVGQALKSYLLGCAGVSALDQAALKLNAQVESLAAQNGWRVGPVLAPGSLAGWPVTDQNALCSLAGAQEVGVEVSPSSLLMPKYSLSLLIGLGPEYTSSKIASGCQYCVLNKSCQYRSENSHT